MNMVETLDLEPEEEQKIDPVDYRVGQNIRKRRRELNLTLGNVALAVGVSYQSMQKYEAGLNRMGASRLFYICKVLEINLDEVFVPLEDEIKDTKKPTIFINPNDPQLQELILSYSNIRDGHVKEYLVDLAALLSRQLVDTE